MGDCVEGSKFSQTVNLNICQIPYLLCIMIGTFGWIFRKSSCYFKAEKLKSYSSFSLGFMIIEVLCIVVQEK